MERTGTKRWLSDVEVEHATDRVTSASFLRKDRIGNQRIPFHRVGRKVVYDLNEVHAAIERMRFGGKVS